MAQGNAKGNVPKEGGASVYHQHVANLFDANLLRQMQQNNGSSSQQMIQNAASLTATDTISDLSIVGNPAIRRALKSVIPCTTLTNQVGPNGQKMTIQQARNQVANQSHRPTKHNSTVSSSHVAASTLKSMKDHTPLESKFLCNKSKQPSNWHRNGLSEQPLNPNDLAHDDECVHVPVPARIETTPMIPSNSFAASAPAPVPETPEIIRKQRNGRKRIRKRICEGNIFC